MIDNHNQTDESNSLQYKGLQISSVAAALAHLKRLQVHLVLHSEHAEAAIGMAAGAGRVGPEVLDLSFNFAP